MAKEVCNVTRRSFVGAAGLAAAGVACSGAIESALADEAATLVAESDIAQTVECDVVIAGAGAAGLAALAAAAEEGAKVVCLEKLSSSMGVGTYYGFINTELTRANGVPDTDETAFEHDIIEACLGATNPALVHNFVKHSAQVGDWMASVAEQTGNSAMFSTAGGSVNTAYFDDSETGSSAYGALSSYAEGFGGQVIYNANVVQLDTDETGRVTGVVAKDSETGEYTRYQAANGVILACGGFTGNADLIAQYVPWVDLDKLTEFNPIAINPDPEQCGNWGDAFTLAEQVGGRIAPAPHCPMIHFIGGAMPSAGNLFVNGAGKRFANEGSSNEVMAQIVMRQPGHTTFKIADSKPSGMALMMQQSDSAEGEGDDSSSSGHGPMAMMGSGDAPTYDTLEELAEANGFDPEVIAATVARWNELVESGVDEDFGSDLSSAVTVDTPPYTCTEGPGCNLAMMGGPQVDENLQVVDADYNPIAGLYAIGNCAGGFFGPNYPMQVHDGMARAFCAVGGYLAAKHALGVEA